MSLPTNPIGLYWPYWNPIRRLVDFPTTHNVIFLFHATPVGGTPGTTGAVTLNKPTGDPGTFYNADIATCKARGQRIILTVGGAGAQTTINTQARADAFIQSIKDINVGLGGSGTTCAFSGLDWNNFEGASVAGSAQWMTYASQQLKTFYGTNFLITAPPAAFSLTVSGQGGIDRAMLATMYAGGALDWMCPQHYDGIVTEAEVQASLDFYNTAVTVDGVSVQIPKSRIGIGFGMRTATWNDVGYWYPAAAATAYTNMVNTGRAPKGAFNWAAQIDPTNSFATIVGPVITNNIEPLSPKFLLTLSTNFINEANTTAQLIAPAGKTTAAFQAGKMLESSNPTTALDLAAATYTEVEWNIQATTDAVNNQQYEFRVTYNGVALDTYSVTPKWTIGTPAATTRQAVGIGSMTGVSSITI